MKHIIRFISTSLIVAVLMSFAPASGSAEFLKLGPLTYASPSGRTFVIVTRAFQWSGLFVIHFMQPQEVQNFSLAEVELSKARTLFVSLNSKTGSYEQIVLPDGGKFILNGGVTVALGERPETRVSVDIGSGLPYLTIVDEGTLGKGTEPGLPPYFLAFSALELIANLDGQEAVALLEANKSQQKKYQDVLSKYSINENNQLVLNKKVVTNTRIGVASEIAAPCSEAGAVIVPEAELKKISEIADESARTAAIQKLKGDSRNKRTLGSYVILSILSKFAAVAMDTATGKFVIIKGTDESEELVCSVKTLKL